MNTNNRTARRGLALTLGALVALSAAMLVSARGKEPIVEGGTLEFDLPDLSETPVSSADPRFAGKVLLVDLWATWCPPCISEIPTLVDLAARHQDRGLIIVGIAFEAEDRADERRAKLRQFVEDHGINYLVLDGGRPEDFESALPSVKNVQGFPVEILVDRRGGVAASRNGYGFKKKWATQLQREIEELLRETPNQADARQRWHDTRADADAGALRARLVSEPSSRGALKSCKTIFGRIEDESNLESLG